MTKTTAMTGDDVTFGAVTATTVNSGTIVKNNFAASTAPGTGDDSDDGYAVGSEWIDTTAGNKYYCTDASVGAAVWKQVGSGSPAPSPGASRSAFVVTSSNAFLLKYPSYFVIPSGSANYITSGSTSGYFWAKGQVTSGTV